MSLYSLSLYCKWVSKNSFEVLSYAFTDIVNVLTHLSCAEYIYELMTVKSHGMM